MYTVTVIEEVLAPGNDFRTLASILEAGLTPVYLEYGLTTRPVIASGRVQRASSDEELMARFADSLDEHSFSLLSERYAEKAHRVALAILGNEEAAADAVQESFLRIVRARSSYRTAEPYQQWYFCILRNICRDELRRKKIVDPQVPAGLNAQVFDPKEKAETQEALQLKQLVRCMLALDR